MSQNFYRPEAVKLICTLNTLIHFVLRSRHFIPQSATLTLFRTPIPAISDLVKLGRSLEKPENKFKSFKANLLELMSFKKNVVWSAYAIFKYSSFSYMISLIKCLIDRSFKTCNNWISFHNDKENIKSNLIKNAYPPFLIDKVIKSTLIISFLVTKIN